MSPPSSLLDLLSAHAPAWAAWIAAAENEWRGEVFPEGGAVARVVRRFAGLEESLSPSAALKQLSLLFNIRSVRTRKEASAAMGEGWIQVSRSAEPAEDGMLIHLPGSAIEVGIGEAPTARRTSICAHEFGHLFFSCLCEIFDAGGVVHTQRLQAAERFSWRFSLEFCCPPEVRSRWTWTTLRAMLPENTGRTLNELGPIAENNLTYWHLAALAHRYHISIRVAVMALDKLPLLKSTRCAVAIFKHAANRISGKEPDLRLLLQARPSGCFLVTNQRASHQGFDGAKDVFLKGLSGRLTVKEEVLSLRVKQSSGTQKWVTINCTVPCIYAPVDVKGEGRYLVVSFRWPG